MTFEAIAIVLSVNFILTNGLYNEQRPISPTVQSNQGINIINPLIRGSLVRIKWAKHGPLAIRNSSVPIGQLDVLGLEPLTLLPPLYRYPSCSKLFIIDTKYHVLSYGLYMGSLGLSLFSLSKAAP